jgi:HTH-type transcriptional regulator/antitoxin HigA
MARRGWIEYSANVDVLERRVVSFFDAKSLQDASTALPYAARRSNPNVEETPAQRAWLARAKQLAQCVDPGQFSVDGIPELMPRLRSVAQAAPQASHVARLLSEFGIRFVVVQGLAGAKIDGACFWLNDSPVIALSMRYDRIDSFWFTLLHEVGHCSQGDESLDSDLDSSRANAQKSPSERAADEFALRQLVEPRDLDSFIARKRPLYSANSILAFAQMKGVHPGIVVGQLQYRSEIKRESFRKFLEPVRDYVTSSALTDGWGVVPHPSTWGSHSSSAASRS